jgi:hypothetical protein
MRLLSPPPFLDLRIDAPVARGDLIEHTARLELSECHMHHLWFRFPSEQANLLTRRADPWVIATLVYAMSLGRPLRVHGRVSPHLLPNLAEFQEAYAALHGGFRPVEIVADEVAELPTVHRPDRGVTAFSAGVDGTFSVYRHTAVSALGPKRALAAALLVHGFDIAVTDAATFAAVEDRCRALARDAGLPLLTTATNLRTLPLDWELYFGNAVAAALTFFQSAFTFGLVPSAHAYRQLHLENGSNQLTDPLLSSASLQIVHDGSAFGRIDKLQHLARWPAARRHLRVCWEGGRADNCCRCEKCIRTMLMLTLCGVDACEAFPHPLTPGDLERLTVPSQGGLHELRYLLAEARRRSERFWWEEPLARAVARNERYLRLRHFTRRSRVPVPLRLRRALAGVARRLFRQSPETGGAALPTGGVRSNA